MPGADPGLARALYQLDQFAGIPMYWLSLLLFGSVMIAARGVFPRWALWFSAILAVLIVLGGLSVKADGASRPGTGLFANLGFGAALVFLLEVGMLLWSATEPEQLSLDHRVGEDHRGDSRRRPRQATHAAVERGNCSVEEHHDDAADQAADVAADRDPREREREHEVQHDQGQDLAAALDRAAALEHEQRAEDAEDRARRADRRRRSA